MYKQEVLAAKQRVIEKVNFMATRLKEKQEVSYQFAVKFWDRQRLELEQKKREAELLPLTQLLSHLENNEHQPLKYNVRSRNGTRTFQNQAPASPSITPRTMRKVADYKIQDPNILNLSNVEPQKYVRPKTPKKQK